MEGNVTTMTASPRQSVSTIYIILLLVCVAALNFSCKPKPTDLRKMVPADSLAFLETNDLAKVLNAVADSKAFQEVVKNRPDFSALQDIQLAVAVTGFIAGFPIVFFRTKKARHRRR